jgi:hypothetical protein
LCQTQRYPSLSALSGSFTHNDGRTAHLLRCEGTLPIVFQASPSRGAAARAGV